MKTTIKLLCLIICCLAPSAAFAQVYGVTKPEALSIAQRQFQGRDVDYFILEDTNLVYWTIFVDAEPMKGWEHECYVLKVPKSTTTSVENTDPLSIEERKLPPSGNFLPLSVKNRYGSNSNTKPEVAKSPTAISNPMAQRTYAIILSGGISKVSNHERYWNDCSFIYQTLLKKYGIPKGNVYPIMSDGNDPAEDMRCTTGEYRSQPLDLDGDGVNDISLAATKSNVQSILNSLKNRTQEDDHLFLFVIDHGGSHDYKKSSYICLWNGEQLNDYELADMLKPFTEKNVNVNVVLGQCYSGGFNDDLTKVGCVVAAASSGSESSWGCWDKPFDEFVYQWTCAVNGADHRNVSVNADVDNNGYVSMQEAFEYAKTHDRWSAEHPQYISTPISVGEDLAFNNVAKSIDLYIKDNPEDTGKEPNLTTDKFWLSPSIWVRNKDDNGTEHENPYYSEDHVAAMVYVRVHNRGKQDYKGGTYYVHVFWAKASTGFNPAAWIGNETYENGEVTGGYLIPTRIPAIPAGGYGDVKIVWALPSELLGTEADNRTEKHHFCLLAKIMDTVQGPWLTGNLTYNCRRSNNDAQKNVSIISKKDLSSGTDIFIRNISDYTRKYTLELIPRTLEDEGIYQHANITMEMSQPIFRAWGDGGYQSNKINRAPAIGPRAVQFISKDSRLEAISLSEREFDKVSLKFNFKTALVAPRNFILDLIQRDENGEIIGGETFIVESPVTDNRPVVITVSSIGDGKSMLSTDVGSEESIRWETLEGEIIGLQDTVEVKANKNSDSTYYAYLLSENGELASGRISLDMETDEDNGIDHISLDENKGTLNIYLRGTVLPESSIAVSSVMTGETIYSHCLAEDEDSVILDTSSLKQGVYVVTYICNGAVIDSVKFSK